MKKIEEIACVILAGGKSSRMQKDKSLLPFGGFKTLCEYQHEKMKKLFEKVYISAKESEKFGFEANFILDDAKEYAPTFALDRIMQSIKEDFFFVMTVDMPFLNESSIKKIIDGFDSAKDATIASHEGQVHTLCGIYGKKIHPAIKKLIKEDRHKLQLFLKEIDTKYIEIDDEESFTNLNYPHEYEKALAR